MKPRKQRMLAIGLSAAGLIVASFLTFRAFEENMMFFVGISDVVERQKIPTNKDFRVGGLVVNGSVHREPGSLTLNFILTDNKNELKVLYTGVLPDLFREGQGVVALGRLENNVFIAKSILAKHDENYMPPEIIESLSEHTSDQL
ncbi:MAG TPA: cytochrome c maturation protein CcmE [Woeseiaceae bacterium]|nr:cytochrome c maturation protein CcmE [Woeseiaceae bacterium]|tara:strand:+ start:6082 stop:6516 length:435 start_codon:yes stop_codon:yes gene_type:complete